LIQLKANLSVYASDPSCYIQKRKLCLLNLSKCSSVSPSGFDQSGYLLRNIKLQPEPRFCSFLRLDWRKRPPVSVATIDSAGNDITLRERGLWKWPPRKQMHRPFSLEHSEVRSFNP
jgi:hypothetical protein